MKILNLLACVIFSFSIFCVKAQEPTVDIQKSLESIIAAEKQRHEILYDFQTSGIGQNYDIKYHRFVWKIDPSVRYISGSVTTYFKAGANLTGIDFDLDNVLTVDSVIHRGTKATFAQTSDKVLKINTNATILTGIMDSVTVYYRGVPPTTGFGSYNQRIRNNTAPETWTLSEPYGSRDWFPGKMDLTDKIDSIDVIVTTPPQYRVASNGLLVREIQLDANNKLYHWKHRYPIANYLICFAVTNYEQYIDKAPLSRGDTMNLLNYVYPESKAASQQWSWKCANALRLYDSLFIEYPFKKEKYGHAMFGWGGGMEHQTMSFMVGITDAGLMAHELAHQWFGDRVTCGSWSEIWLNESFATYLTGLYYQYVEPLYWSNWRTSVLSSATSPTNGSVFCTDTTDVNRIFNSNLSYNKGAYVLHTLRWKVGDTAFFKGLRNYLNDPSVAYGFGHTADLKRHIEATSGQNLTEFFNDYFYGQGYPSYRISGCELHAFNPNDTTNTTNRFMPSSPNETQSVFYLNISQTTSDPSVPLFEMPVPIKFANNTTGKDTTIVFDITRSFQSFNVLLNFHADNIVFDPEMRILSKNNTIGTAICDATQEIDNQWIAKISPNPATNILNFKFNNLKTENASIQIVDALGQVVFSEKRNITVGENALSLDIQKLPSGIYFLKLSTNEHIGSKKFVKL